MKRLFSLILIPYGAVGMILANIISMKARIFISYNIIAEKCYNKSLISMIEETLKCIPRLNIIISYLLVNMIFYFKDDSTMNLALKTSKI